MDSIIFFKPIDKEAAEDLATWKYEPPLDLYNHTEPAEYCLRPENNYFVAYKGDKILGFYCFGEECIVSGGDYEVEALDIGIGLNPEFVGQGFGKAFFKAAIMDIGRTHPGMKIRLTVANFNKVAIKVYEVSGFVKESEFIRKDGMEFSIYTL